MLWSFSSFLMQNSRTNTIRDKRNVDHFFLYQYTRQEAILSYQITRGADGVGMIQKTVSTEKFKKKKDSKKRKKYQDV